ncbi:hypothetical protein ACFX19_017353 [Malus domestica]
MAKRNRALHLNAMLYHCSEEFREETLPPEWNQMAFPKLTKLTQLLKNVDLIDGRLVNIDGGSITIDDRVAHKMLSFKSLARIFIGAPLVQKALQNNVAALSGGRICNPYVCFGTPSEREPSRWLSEHLCPTKAVSASQNIPTGRITPDMDWRA